MPLWRRLTERFNPKQVKKFHDLIMTWLCGLFLFLPTACVSVGSTKYIWETIVTKLSISGHVSYAVQNLVKEKRRFMNVLFKKYSTMTQERSFSDTFSTTALAVYDEFESRSMIVTDFIIEKGKNRFSILMLPKPYKAARSSYRL